ncbi:MAG: hypothetical protein INH41_19040 [Myxococcaceae bacterium]|jgi:hypothetical protein|nr:hypothetical protein [Myxococcaceae bacterium]MCA3014483.1 hypothetical protein [Myxococcaceae bacterium]
MAKTSDDDGTIENRVYLFEALATAFVEGAAGELSAKSPQRRARALRALADLAFVSCTVADTQHQSPKAVRRAVLRAAALGGAPEAHADGPDDEG